MKRRETKAETQKNKSNWADKKKYERDQASKQKQKREIRQTDRMYRRQMSRLKGKEIYVEDRQTKAQN